MLLLLVEGDVLVGDILVTHDKADFAVLQEGVHQ